jgi:hypothetical protein
LCAEQLDPFYVVIFFVYVSPFNIGVIRVAEKSAIQRVKDLDAERAGIFEQAKEEALEKAKAAVAELNARTTRCPMPAESKPRLGLAKANARSRLQPARFASFRRCRHTMAGPTEVRKRKAHFRRVS